MALSPIRWVDILRNIVGTLTEFYASHCTFPKRAQDLSYRYSVTLASTYQLSRLPPLMAGTHLQPQTG